MAQRTIIAYFDTRSEAEAARTALASAGVASDAITLLANEGTAYTRGSTETSYDYRADRGGLWALLGNLFLPNEDRYSYAEGLSRGGVVLSVTTDDANYDGVADLLERSGADNIDEREAEWRSAGWTGYAASDATAGAAGMTSTTILAGAAAPVADDVVQVVEEQLRVGKRETESGRVRIRSYVKEVPVEAQVELHSTRVEVVRRPVNQAVSLGEAVFQDRVIEAREHAEQAVVAKEARVVEEIGLHQETETRTETVSDTVRKTEVEVDDERTGEVTRITGDEAARTGR